MLQPNAGLYAAAWAREAGFDPAGIETRLNGFLNCDEASRANLRAMAEDWLQETSAFRKAVLAAGMKEEDLEEVVEAMRKWEGVERSWHSMACAEMICRA